MMKFLSFFLFLNCVSPSNISRKISSTFDPIDPTIFVSENTMLDFSQKLYKEFLKIHKK